MAVTFEHTNLTVDLAGDLLTNNTGNRPFKHSAIDRYVRDILENRWHFTGDPVKVDKNGRLLDGQNRCMALLKAAEESDNPSLIIPILLVRGLEPESQDYMDQGITRSVSDQLARRGVMDYSSVASATRLVIQFDKGWLPNGDTPTKSQSIEFYDANRVIFNEFTHAARSLNFSSLTPSTLLAGAFLIYRKTEDPDAVHTFLEALKGGVGLESGDPILALRNRAMQARNSQQRLDNTVALLMMLRCWNAWRNGTKMEKFPMRTRGRVITVTEIEK